MENNKLLIGVQFTEYAENGKFRHTNIELYVVRDITLHQLLEGIKYGLVKMAKQSQTHKEIYANCFSLFDQCTNATFEDKNGRTYFRNISLTSFNGSTVAGHHDEETRFAFATDEINRPICDLGFVTASRIIFDATGSFTPQGKLDTSKVIEAFNPEASQKIFFPEYNCSSRLLYQFDTTAVDVIPPTDPPQKSNRSLFSVLVPSLLSMGIMIVMRMAMGGTEIGSILMALMCAVMGIIGIINTASAFRRQKAEYAENLKNWREHYQTYINDLIATVRMRQNRDAAKMNSLYPDMLTLINPDQKGVYGLNENIYSRAPQDEDFLTFRIGVSDDVPSHFEVKGDSKDVVYADTFFDFSQENGQNRLHIYLRDELGKNSAGKVNLCKLPGVLSKQFSRLPGAPLLYSLKNKGCLGIVDRHAGEIMSRSYYFISRMIFELCYYHRPEDLQFVVFFPQENNWDKIEDIINRYKFMPHFRGLFADKSQFVFNKEDAHAVMSNLLSMMSSRKEKGPSAKQPHIVMIVFDEYGLKEHAFAEYLPEVPEEGTEFTNDLGLSFVFAAKHKEYLPAYCDDIVTLENGAMTLTPRCNVDARKRFRYENFDKAADPKQFYLEYTKNITFAFRFFSSVHYALIAQNGKVPSSVSMFDMFDRKTPLDQMIQDQWGLGTAQDRPSITKTLRVPVGKTETGLTYLDLHEKADGPHMLVAGTTGSGKTEAIISYLLGLCMQYRPDELNLLLIDMKGGGFTKRIGSLPHVVGSVTDVDGDENGTGAVYMLHRFLYAMKAEIKRRKLLFNKLGVDSIDDYIQACANIENHIKSKKLTGDAAKLAKDTAQSSPLSHLILVVDEFTELKRFTSENDELDFLGEITTLARIGRSLGFHIILISQNIEGAITDDIRINSKARLCLKVATKQASKEMIGTELAASASMPGLGRAYLLVGTGSRFEYFQSAYSGADVEQHIPVEITLASKTGPYTCFYHSAKDNRALRKLKDEQKQAGTSQNQLEAICQAISNIYESNPQLKKPHTVFSAPLPACIAWDQAQNAVVEVKDRKQVNT